MILADIHHFHLLAGADSGATGTPVARLELSERHRKNVPAIGVADLGAVDCNDPRYTRWEGSLISKIGLRVRVNGRFLHNVWSGGTPEWFHLHTWCSEPVLARKQPVEFFLEAGALIVVFDILGRQKGELVNGAVVIGHALHSKLSHMFCQFSDAEGQPYSLGRSEFIERSVIECGQRCQGGGVLGTIPRIAEILDISTPSQENYRHRFYRYLVHNGLQAALPCCSLSDKHLPRVCSRVVRLLGAQSVGKDDCYDRSNGLYPTGPVGARARSDSCDDHARRRPMEQRADAQHAQAKHSGQKHEQQQNFDRVSGLGHGQDIPWETGSYYWLGDDMDFSRWS